ncbi:glycosyltransferase family 4 protein [Cephaloticoccus primus]|uniref:glycosyltransferase family 4 protein n=1 Tax=Cephaloticoccus primus TaxID=1548207 RepID=UPI000839AE3B|nr:glycosyltransferase family 4 protein [Cephaloticoccus primus]
MPQPPPRTHLFITHEFYPRRGGIATFVEEIARAASALGHEVEVWAQALPRGAPERSFPFRLRRLPLAGSHDLGCRLKLARALLRQRQWLRHASVYLVEPGPILAFLWLQFCLRPRELSLTFHGSDILKLSRNLLHRALLRRLIARADRISTLTRYTRDLLFAHFPEARARFVLSPGALRHDFAEATPTASPAGGQSEANPPAPKRSRERRLIILTVGRLHPRKGQQRTLAALTALPAELRRRVEYWLVGSSAERGAGKRYAQQLRAQAAAAAPDLCVKFLGDVPDEQLGAVYAQADIFALTSVAHGPSVEGFGLVYLEAAAHGLPIVAHDIGGVSEAVCAETNNPGGKNSRESAHERPTNQSTDRAAPNGLLVVPEGPDSLEKLRDAFARLVTDDALRARLGAAGPTWARRQSWQDSAAALLGVKPPRAQTLPPLQNEPHTDAASTAGGAGDSDFF